MPATFHIAADETKEVVSAARTKRRSICSNAGRATRRTIRYFTDNMRDWLYSDSPRPIRMDGARSAGCGRIVARSALRFARPFAFGCADDAVSRRALVSEQRRFLSLVMAPKDGPLREKLNAEGIPLIIDRSIETEASSFARFARDFDCIIANTILSGAVVRAMKNENVPIAWWLHEPALVGEHYIREDAKLRAALPLAGCALRSIRADRRGLSPVHRSSGQDACGTRSPDLDWRVNEAGGRNVGASAPFSSARQRRAAERPGCFCAGAGVAAARTVQEAAQFQIGGRIPDPDFWPKVEAVATTVKNFSVRGVSDHTEAIDLMREADVLVSASRDEAMPTITVLEAMSLGKALIATERGRSAGESGGWRECSAR